jgi:hydratase-aldolase
MLTAQDLKGVMALMPAFATDDAGDLEATSTVDVEKLATGVDRLIRDGIDCIVTTGSAGECYNLDWDEFTLLVNTTMEVVNKRVPLVVGTSSPSAREVVKKMKFLESVGAEATLLGLPYYSAKSPDYIVEFYRRIGEMFPRIGIMVYHVPQNHKTVIPMSCYPGLAKIPQIVAAKDTHRETRQFIDVMNIVADKISLFVHQEQFYPYGRLGASGFYSGTVWMGPWPLLHLRNLVREGREAESQQLTAEIKTASRAAERAGKVADKLAGYSDPGPERGSILALTEKDLAGAKSSVEQWKALCDRCRPLVEAQPVGAH